jgi:hypothetical protein
LVSSEVYSRADDPEIYPVIVTFGAPEWALRTAEALSGAGMRPVCISTHPHATRPEPFVCIPNVGYGAAVNAGFVAHGRPTSGWILALNDDIAPTAESVRALIRLLSEAPDCVAVISLLGSTTGFMSQELRRRHGHAPHGGSIAVRAQAFAQLRGFTDALFLYHEEVDLCLRLPDGTTCLAVELEGWNHAGAMSSRRQPAALFELGRSGAVMRKMHLGRRRELAQWVIRGFLGNSAAGRPVGACAFLTGVVVGLLRPTYEGVAARSLRAAPRWERTRIRDQVL